MGIKLRRPPKDPIGDILADADMLPLFRKGYGYIDKSLGQRLLYNLQMAHSQMKEKDREIDESRRKLDAWRASENGCADDTRSKAVALIQEAARLLGHPTDTRV